MSELSSARRTKHGRIWWKSRGRSCLLEGREPCSSLVHAKARARRQLMNCSRITQSTYSEAAGAERTDEFMQAGNRDSWGAVLPRGGRCGLSLSITADSLISMAKRAAAAAAAADARRRSTTLTMAP